MLFASAETLIRQNELFAFVPSFLPFAVLLFCDGVVRVRGTLFCEKSDLGGVDRAEWSGAAPSFHLRIKSSERMFAVQYGNALHCRRW